MMRLYGQLDAFLGADPVDEERKVALEVLVVQYNLHFSDPVLRVQQERFLIEPSPANLTGPALFADFVVKAEKCSGCLVRGDESTRVCFFRDGSSGNGEGIFEFNLSHSPDSSFGDISKFLQFCNDFVSVWYPGHLMRRGSALNKEGNVMHAYVRPEHVEYQYDFFSEKGGRMYFTVTTASYREKT